MGVGVGGWGVGVWGCCEKGDECECDCGCGCGCECEFLGGGDKPVRGMWVS